MRSYVVYRGSQPEISDYIVLYVILCVSSRGTGEQACNCKCDRLWVRFSTDEIKYLIFLFLRSGVEAKHGVEFRHSVSQYLLIEFG